MIPAIIFAFSLCVFCLSKASVFFESQYKVKIDKIPSFDSSLQGILIGTVIPLLSSVLPIQAALKKSLVDSLDT